MNIHEPLTLPRLASQPFYLGTNKLCTDTNFSDAVGITVPSSITPPITSDYAVGLKIKTMIPASAPWTCSGYSCAQRTPSSVLMALCRVLPHPRSLHAFLMPPTLALAGAANLLSVGFLASPASSPLACMSRFTRASPRLASFSSPSHLASSSP